MQRRVAMSAEKGGTMGAENGGHELEKGGHD